MPVNEYGQMIGELMEGYTPGELPSIDFLEGRYARIEPLSVEKHAEDLLAVYGPDTPREMWTYLFQEPVADMEELVTVFNQNFQTAGSNYPEEGDGNATQNWTWN